MLEIGKHENQHRVRKRYVAKGIDEGKVSFKDHDEGRASERGTPGKQASTATPLEDVRTCLFSSSSNMVLRETSNKDTHYNEQGRAEVIRSETSSGDSNLSVAQWWLEVMKDVREETMKPQLKCLSLCAMSRFRIWRQAHRERPDICCHDQPTIGREIRQALKTRQHEKMKYFIDVEEAGKT